MFAMRKPRVLFLCPGSSSRSQIAEVFAQLVSKDRIEAFSAGAEAEALEPLAVRAMAEVGVDASGHSSTSMEQLRNESFDFVIAVCERAKEACPAWPRVDEPLLWSIEEPSAATGSEEDRLQAFRRVRDQIRQRTSLFLLANKLV